MTKILSTKRLNFFKKFYYDLEKEGGGTGSIDFMKKALVILGGLAHD